ncbi:MAG: hypothetical protein ACLP5E_07380 [Streptosporangiaceae bacterium]
MELARAGLVTAGPAIIGAGSSELPGTRHIAAMAGPGVLPAATSEGIQRANRLPRKRLLRADFIAAPSH